MISFFAYFVIPQFRIPRFTNSPTKSNFVSACVKLSEDGPCVVVYNRIETVIKGCCNCKEIWTAPLEES